VIVTDSKRAAKTGNFLEIVGSYDARQGKPELNSERILHWIKNGAQVSDTVHNLLVKAKIIDGKIIVQIPEKPAEKAAEVFTEKAGEAPAPVSPEAPAPAAASEESTETPAEPAAE
jgi:small subunit ribosomal protein S16